MWYVLFGVFCLILLWATITDFRALVIPDFINIFGALLGLLLSVFFENLLWYPHRLQSSLTAIEGLDNISKSFFGGRLSLLLAVMSFLLWCFALVATPFKTRRGFRFGLLLWFHKMGRELRQYQEVWAFLLIGVGLLIGVSLYHPEAWVRLCSATLGLGFGVASSWLFRSIIGAMVGREVLGFGDVLLMGTIGAWLGWQACLIIPFVGVSLGMIPLIIVLSVLRKWKRGLEVPFGPFLALGSVVTVLAWDHLSPNLFLLLEITSGVEKVSLLFFIVIVIALRTLVLKLMLARKAALKSFG